MDYMEPLINSSSTKILLQVEIWQAQNYWPIKGWAAPLSGTPHFACTLLPPQGAEQFPDELAAPPGWDWADKWSIDLSIKYGQPDNEGWFYSASFDRLGEMLKAGTAVGTMAKTSMVRKRRWVRSVLCTSTEVQEKIRQRIEQLQIMRSNIEAALRNKEAAFRAVKFYEENRSFVFAQSLHLATQGTLNTLSIVKELMAKLKLFKLYLQDRISMERDHAKRLESIGHKFSSLFQQSNGKGGDQFVLINSSNSNKVENNNDSSYYENTEIQPPKSMLKCAEVFFSKVYLASQASSQSLQDYSLSLLQLVSDDVDQMLVELQTILKDARAVFRKNSDICRLSEAAIRNFLNSVNIAFESVTNSSMKEIGMIAMELNGLKGGLPYNAAYFNANLNPSLGGGGNSSSGGSGGSSSSSSNSVIDFSALSFEDPSLASTASVAPTGAHGGVGSGGAVTFKGGDPLTVAALAVATTAMATNAWTAASLLNTHNPSASNPNPNQAAQSSRTLLSQVVVHAQPREDLWLSIQRYKIAVRESQEALCVLISESMDLELQQQILANRVHTMFTALIKQYAKSELTLFSELHACWTKLMKDALTTIKHGGLPYPVLQSPFAKLDIEYVENEDSVTNSVGIFSFTKLFKDPLPVCPGIVRSGEVLYSHASDFQKSKNILFDGIWKTVYVVATSDGYLHMLQSQKCDIPNRSFYLKQCIINEHMRDKKYREVVNIVFELSYSSLLTQKKSTKPLSMEGVYFRVADAAECHGWIADLLQLTTRPIHVDEDVEREAQASMLQCLPILRGETEKIDLELKKYEELNQQAILSTMDETEQQQQQQAAVQQAADNHISSNNEGNDDTNNNNDLDAQPSTSDTNNMEEDAVVVGEDEEDYDEAQSQAADSASTTPTTASSAAHAKTKKQWKVESGPYILPQKAPTMSTATTPKTNSTNFGFVASTYKKDAEAGWVKKDDAVPSPAMRGAVAGMVPVANITPKQIIPVVDARVPLARRHSQLIEQYEKGLKEEKAKASQKVNETRGKRLKDLILEEDDEGIDAIEHGDRDVDGGTHHNAHSSEGVLASLSADQQDMPELTSSNASGKKLVKKLSQKFDLGSSGGMARTQSSDQLSRASSPMRITTEDSSNNSNNNTNSSTPIHSSNVFRDIHEEGQQPTESS